MVNKNFPKEGKIRNISYDQMQQVFHYLQALGFKRHADHKDGFPSKFLHWNKSGIWSSSNNREFEKGSKECFFDKAEQKEYTFNEIIGFNIYELW